MAAVHLDCPEKRKTNLDQTLYEKQVGCDNPFEVDVSPSVLNIFDFYDPSPPFLRLFKAQLLQVDLPPFVLRAKPHKTDHEGCRDWSRLSQNATESPGFEAG